MKRTLIFAVLLSTQLASAFAVEYPEIRSLSRDDLLFVQLQDEVDNFYYISRQRECGNLPPVDIFTYRRGPSDDLFSLGARLNLAYDTLATLNCIENAAELRRLDHILVSSQPGLFIHDPPRTELEHMILGSRLGHEKEPEKLVVWREGAKEGFLFFPGSLFNDVERAYFLQILFRFPITTGSITSRYGPRLDPFSGHPEFHSGIDIGAPEGTDVHAAREGIVAARGNSPVLGYYVILNHPDGYQTVYGHLAAFGVTLGQEVIAGAIIGKVGKTGMATGPHLHFEVRKKGCSEDPFQFLRVRG